ncbi:MAG: hypothetical protein DRP01_01065 [Archaeoglobales archaeon]|nr:MAG: hypothetical protein DRP01_01065 [Archaeoglobales archaeon]
MKLKRVLWMAFGILVTPAILYLTLMRALYNHLQARRIIKRVAKSNNPKDRLIRFLVYKIFGM